MKKSFALFALLALAACATSPENRYYVLTPGEKAAASLDQSRAASAPDLSVTIPAYLDRPQIVFIDNEGKVSIHEFDRWAEPVEGMIRRVMAQDMQVLPPVHRPIDLTIDDFIFGGGQVILKAHWIVGRPGAKTPPAPHAFAASLPTGGDAASSVVAMSQLLDRCAQEIVATH